VCCGGGGGGGGVVGGGRKLTCHWPVTRKMLIARRLRTTIAVADDMLRPSLYDPKEVLPKLKERQRKQNLQHDKIAGELPPLRDDEVVSVREGNKWKYARCARVSQVLPSSRPYKVETARGGGYRRNCRHLLRTEESQIPEITHTPDVSNDEELTDTKVEPSPVTVAHENPGSPPAGMSMATTTRSGRTVREPQGLKDYVKY